MVEVIEERTTWLRRLRSTVLLLVTVTVLGAAAAGVIGIAVVVGSSVLDQALG